VYALKIQEFVDACYQLTGYKVEMPADRQYRLHPIYAEVAKRGVGEGGEKGW